MATFNTIPGMSNGGNPPDNMAMNHGAGHQLGIDPFESELAFDESMLRVLPFLLLRLLAGGVTNADRDV